ncbi:MAG: UvrD-helicase domain-containing protein [Deltaproteobacteria bacterium]|nr:UvrD-helicase domain-containing protein [Deltaproteobacteria bacterium]
MDNALKNRLNACRIDKSIALVAPAGSGKTTVLIARILTLAAFKEDINSIVAITYTDNAAAGIKERIIEVARQVYEDYITLEENGKKDEFISLKLIFYNSFIKSEAGRSDAGIKDELDDFIKINFNFVKPDEVGRNPGGRRTGEAGLNAALQHRGPSDGSGSGKLLTPVELYLTVLNNLSNINISTFHGFFHKIINLFPIESGLLPGFGIIDDNESVYIKKNLINEFFLTRLSGSLAYTNYTNENKYHSLEQRLIDFFYVFNDRSVNFQRGVDLVLNSVLEKFDLVVYSINLFIENLKPGIDYFYILNCDIGQVLDLGIIEYIFALEEDDIALFNKIKDSLEDFENLILESFGFLFENENSKKLLALLDRALCESKNAAVKEGLELLSRNIKLLAAGGGGENKDIRFLINLYKIIGSGLEKINYFINLHKTPLILNNNEKHLLSLLYSAFMDFYKKANFLNYISFTIVIFKIIKEYEDKKRSRNVVDFSGIEFKTLTLLNSANFQYIEEKLNYRLNHLVIDEFQDANRIEFDIIKRMMDERLSGMGLSGEKPVKGTIFFVGDPNQSIYGFRSSDYKIFNEAILYFKSKISPDFGFDEIVLEENFRSTKKLIEFQNLIFSHPYFECLTGGAVNVSPGNKNSGGICNPDFYPVILKLYKNSRNESLAGRPDSDSCGDSEDLLTAYEIRRLLDFGNKNNLPLASRIKIVSRKHQGKDWDNLKNALVQNSVPFKIYGDKGFYEKKEIDLIISILKFFFNGRDELSIFKVLKILSNTKYNEAIPPETVNFVKTGFEKLLRLTAANEKNIQINNLSPYSMLKRIYSIFNTYSLYSSDAQALANLKKLLLIAQSYDRTTVYEFLRDLEERINRGYKEPEEEVDIKAKEPGNDGMDNGKVSLMTIHGAKGLESDIVFIYGTSLNPPDNKKSGLRYKFDIIFNGNRPEFILLNDKLTDNPLSLKSGWGNNRKISDILDKKREKEITKEENEFKRLIYVALTRPRFLCYITDEVKDSNKNNKNGGNSGSIGADGAGSAAAPGPVSWADILCGQKDLTLFENARKIRELVLTLKPGNADQTEDRFEKIVSFIKNNFK